MVDAGGDSAAWFAFAGVAISSIVSALVALWISARRSRSEIRQFEIEMQKLRSEQLRELSDRKLDIAYRYAELRQKSEDSARDFLSEVAKETAIGFLYLDDDETKSKIWIRDNANLLIGRRDSCDIVLSNAYVSREHCVLSVSAGSLCVVPLNPTNPVEVNGTAIAARTPLAPGDELFIAPYRFRYFSLM